MSEIEIIRSVKMKQSIEKTLVGDVIQFTLKTGEIVQAMKMTEGGIWCFVDCLKDECSMKRMDEYLAAVMEQFPEDIRQMMKPFDDGRMLRLPTEKEIFGTNKVGEPEHDSVQQWEPMKSYRNHIAFQRLNDDWEWWWTETPHKRMEAYFALVNRDGARACLPASYSLGVRPTFRLRRKEKG